MKNIPETNNSPVLRTDFSDESRWNSLCSEILQPNADGFRAYVEFINDPEFDNLTVDQLASIKPRDLRFVFIVDKEAISNPEHPVLVVDLADEPGRSFRVIPSEMWGVENNLSLANMDFEEFANAVDEDGVFRGFSE